MISVDISRETRDTYLPNGDNAVWYWCLERFGIPNGERWIWDTYWKFTFKYEADATLFALRWA